MAQRKIQTPTYDSREEEMNQALSAHPVFLEASCSTCGESFTPADEDDTVHIERNDGTECGGQGVIIGGWFSRAIDAENYIRNGGTS